MKQASMAVISFSAKGELLAEKVKSVLKNPVNGCQWTVETVRRPEDIKVWCKEQFETKDAILFIGAIGIAVRKIAPYLVHKTVDPAVLVMDDLGLHVIPILSGHIGGGNALAHVLADLTGAKPVITTASDIHGKIAIDVFAKENHLHISSMKMATKVATAIVDEEPVSFYCDGLIDGNVPKELLSEEDSAKYHVLVSPRRPEEMENVFWLIPKAYVLGVGCKKGKSLEEIETAVLEVLESYRIPVHSIDILASIDLKKDEQGLLKFCEKYHLPSKFYSSEELLQVPGDFDKSEFVKSITGVDNVCERAVMCRILEEQKDVEKEDVLVIEKTKKDGVTVALGMRKWGVTFG